MSKPIYRDPVQDGAADPTVIRNVETGAWWLFYTNRQPAAEGGKRWIHGSPIGIAISKDDGASWRYYGTVRGLDAPGDPVRNTHWAPEIIHDGALYHMYLTYISGVPDSTLAQHPRSIVHFTSLDLETWTRIGPITLSSNRVIDACVFACPDKLWRMWYKNEADGDSTWVATSPDLYAWTVVERVIPGKPHATPHEGPNVFYLSGWYWMVVDEWHGQAVYRSPDTLSWKRRGIFGNEPGSEPDDLRYVRHVDVEVVADYAVCYYFTHPEWDETSQSAGPQSVNARKTAIHHAILRVVNDDLQFQRDVDLKLPLLNEKSAFQSVRTTGSKGHT
ncbi:family 43 glycosylhydrolase [Affinirhizobium pseudoryzae]|uniref:family 43 glycosylhydrolase n=1 Tax=Allorhizobium pseudoryzae TaxID=379684 RepID=UPI001F1DC6AF|nr:family 43 glycosylhydrolase [Allorhizobium pseudoryzae]